MVLGQGGSTLATPRLDDKAQCAWMKRCGSVCACVCVCAYVCVLDGEEDEGDEEHRGQQHGQLGERLVLPPRA